MSKDKRDADDHGLLDEQQIAQCARVDEVMPFGYPIPTRMISNGEYMPLAQTERQKYVEARVDELAESASKRLGISRRAFLAGSGGMAASLLALNEVFGRIFDVDPIEMFEPAAFAQSAVPRDLFVFDGHLHCVRGNFPKQRFTEMLAPLRAAAQGPTSAPLFKSNPLNPTNAPDEHGAVWAVWNPALVGLPIKEEDVQVGQFIKDVFLESQVTVGLLSNITGGVLDGVSPGARNVVEARPEEFLTAAQTAAARDFVNKIAGSTRLLAHGLLYVGKGNLGYLQEQIDRNQPDSFKGYNISNAAKLDDDPNSLMRQWRHDDENVAYPSFELIEKNYQTLKDKKPGLKNICVHKGLAPGPSDPLRGHPGDLPKAARDWPGLNFITYHACIQPLGFLGESLQGVKSGRMRGGVPDIAWTTEYAQLVGPFRNCYADIGTMWASSIVTFPTVAAHLMGQLMKYMGEDRILFGSDAVWYGSPQWQIEALWRFQMPEDLRRRYGYPELTPTAKRKILGLNSARLYGLMAAEGGSKNRVYRPVPKDYERRMTREFKTVMEFPGYAADAFAKAKEQYATLGVEPTHTRYGWIRVKS